MPRIENTNEHSSIYSYNQNGKIDDKINKLDVLVNKISHPDENFQGVFGSIKKWGTEKLIKYRFKSLSKCPLSEKQETRVLSLITKTQVVLKSKKINSIELVLNLKYSLSENLKKNSIDKIHVLKLGKKITESSDALLDISNSKTNQKTVQELNNSYRYLMLKSLFSSRENKQDKIENAAINENELDQINNFLNNPENKDLSNNFSKIIEKFITLKIIAEKEFASGSLSPETIKFIDNCNTEAIKLLSSFEDPNLIILFSRLFSSIRESVFPSVMQDPGDMAIVIGFPSDKNSLYEGELKEHLEAIDLNLERYLNNVLRNNSLLPQFHEDIENKEDPHPRHCRTYVSSEDGSPANINDSTKFNGKPITVVVESRVRGIDSLSKTSFQINVQEIMKEIYPDLELPNEEQTQKCLLGLAALSAFHSNKTSDPQKIDDAWGDINKPESKIKPVLDYMGVDTDNKEILDKCQKHADHLSKQFINAYVQELCQYKAVS
ncbi:MAG: hypothetical protein CMO81_00995 [Waddliaceae bacterium]|nr:hypothetical protein [Waddliaceae bacterium]